MGSRGNVWLAVSGLVIDEEGRWLVVKKKYGGLQGLWSLPAGFVAPGETVDEAIKREILEETGISVEVSGLIGLRTGVLQSNVSDNMIIFACKPKNNTITIQEKELEDVRWLTPAHLLETTESAIIIREMIKGKYDHWQKEINGLNPGNQFGYTSYKLFF